MEVVQIISPLVGLVLGAILTGITSHIRARNERKRVIASALSDLLEVRHRIVGVDLVLKKIASIANIGPHQISGLRSLVELHAVTDSELDNRYNAAITLLAGVAPVLAFDLRSKNALPKVLASLRKTAAESNADLSEFEAFEAMLRTAIVPNLNGAIQRLAWHHSLLTGFEVRRLLRSSDKLPPEAEIFFENIRTLPSLKPFQEGAPEVR